MIQLDSIKTLYNGDSNIDLFKAYFKFLNRLYDITWFRAGYA